MSLKNSFLTWPKRNIYAVLPSDCPELFQPQLAKVYLQGGGMIAPYCSEGVPIEDNRGEDVSCVFRASWDPPQAFDEFGNPLPLIWENVFLVFSSLNSWFGENDLPNGDVLQWIMDVNSDRAWDTPLVGSSEIGGENVINPITNPCNPSGRYVTFGGGFIQEVEVRLNIPF